MREIELKILEVDVPTVVGQLMAFGAKKVFDGNMDVIFYDFDDDRLREKDQRLRIRDKGETVEFTLKKKLKKDLAKIAEEYEVEVSDFQALQKILESVGLLKVRRYQKHRMTYKLQGVSFEFDTITSGVPTFLEIEAGDVETVHAWVKKLGFSPGRAKPWSGTDVLKYYGKL